MIPRFDRVIAIIVLVASLLALSLGAKAQNVRLEGNVFVQQQTAGDSTRTEYYYQDKDGMKYPIFLSSKGKAYIWMRSKKTNKMYRRYLPKITEKLNKKK